jgi:hypothetical protein
VNDPLTSLIGPWGQFGIWGAVVVALGWAVLHLWKNLNESRTAHLTEVRRCGDEMRDMAVKQIDSNHKLASALEGVERIVETALDALKK